MNEQLPSPRISRHSLLRGGAAAAVGLFDAGATWENGALLKPPAGQAPASDDVTVAFDPQGRGYLCATRADNSPGGRAMLVSHSGCAGSAGRTRRESDAGHGNGS